MACRCSFYSSVEVVQFAKSLSDHSFIDTMSNKFFPHARTLSLNGYATFLRLFDAAVLKVRAFYCAFGSRIAATPFLFAAQV